MVFCERHGNRPRNKISCGFSPKKSRNPHHSWGWGLNLGCGRQQDATRLNCSIKMAKHAGSEENSGRRNNFSICRQTLYMRHALSCPDAVCNRSLPGHIHPRSQTHPSLATYLQQRRTKVHMSIASNTLLPCPYTHHARIRVLPINPHWADEGCCPHRLSSKRALLAGTPGVASPRWR